jgi:hypothetical protein
MNDRNLDQLLKAWMDLGPTTAPDRVAEAARLEARSTRQTAALGGWPPRRFPLMNNTVRLALATAAAVVVALLGYTYFFAPSVGAPGLDDPTPSPSPSPNLLPSIEGALDAGTYSLGDEFPVGLTFEVPTGWTSCSSGPLEQGICAFSGTAAAPGGVGVAFLVVENVVEDPCDETSLLDPPVGPSVEELAAAISNLPGFDVTTAEDVTVDGFTAKRLTVTAPEAAACEGLSTWATPDRVNGVSFGEVNSLYLVDVDGVRIVISTAHFPLTSPGDLSAADDVIASIEIEP